MVEAFLALGSNIGNRRENLRKAIEALRDKLLVLKVSQLYETEPMYVENQGWFLNCVVKIDTSFSPQLLLRLVKEIEERLGRKREQRFGPRIIDIDVLFYDQEILSESDLEIPHPRIQERPFVLVPLAEIEPELIHPRLAKTISELLGSLHSEKRVVKLDQSSR